MTQLDGTEDLIESNIHELAYLLWLERGCPCGTPQVDWYAAVDQLRATVILQRSQRPEGRRSSQSRPSVPFMSGSEYP